MALGRNHVSHNSSAQGWNERAAAQGRAGRPFGLALIAVYKLTKAFALALGGLVVFRLGPIRLVERLLHLVARLRLDPDDRLIHLAIAKISGLEPEELAAIGVGLVVYGLLYAVEGIGVWFQKVWAEYLVILTTGLLIPFEVYEVFRKPGSLRVAVLGVNVLVVVYLVKVLCLGFRGPNSGEPRSAVSEDAAPRR